MAWKTEDPSRMAENQRQESIALFRSIAITATEFKTTIESNVNAMYSMEGHTQSLNAACENVKNQLRHLITIEESLIELCGELIDQLTIAT